MQRHHVSDRKVGLRRGWQGRKQEPIYRDTADYAHSCPLWNPNRENCACVMGVFTEPHR